VRADRVGARVSLREPLVRLGRRIDHALGRRLTRLRVLADVRTPMNLAVLRPVWSVLARDPRVAVSFTAEQPDAVRAMLEQDGLAEALIERDAATWVRWDLVMTADAWNLPELRRCRRRLQFFHGVAGKYDLDAPRRIGAAGFGTFDRVAFINEDRMRRYIHAGVVAQSQAVLVGYPKADDLVNGRWSPSLIRQSLGLSPSRPTAIYAPTFSVASSLHHAGLEIVRTLLDQGLNVIVKLHDRSMVPDAHYTGGIDWPRQLSVFHTRPGFALAQGADVEPFLAAADILVTDHSTVGFEFALLDRPIVVYDAPDLLHAARIDVDKWASLRAMSHLAHTPSELAAAVAEALANPGSMAAERRRARDLFASPGSATHRALAVVYELLDLAPPHVLVSNDGCPVSTSAPPDQACAQLRG